MFLSINSYKKCILTLRKLQNCFVYSLSLLNCDITTLLKVESADTTVDKNNYHRKDLYSNLGTFHSFLLPFIMQGSRKISKLTNLFFLKKPSFKSKILDAIEFSYFFGCINHRQNPERIFLWF